MSAFPERRPHPKAGSRGWSTSQRSRRQCRTSLPTLPLDFHRFGTFCFVEVTRKAVLPPPKENRLKASGATLKAAIPHPKGLRMVGRVRQLQIFGAFDIP